MYVALKGKQLPFALAYLKNGFNGTKAAREAGYKGSDAVLAQIAYENLRKPEIVAFIKSQMSEMVMSAEEALVRLSMTARGDLGEFANMSESELVNHPQSHLLHTIKRRTIPQKNAEPIVELEIKLYDAQAAQIQILRQHALAEGRPTEIVKLYETVSPDDWDEPGEDL